MSFATPAQLQQRVDLRALGDLLADDGTTVDATSQLTNANLQAALDDASGEIVVACISNQHYAVSDLQALAVAGTPSSFTLIRLNCALALPLLFGRRVYNDDEINKRIPDFEWSEKMLEMLKNGQRVFELPADNIQAGVMSVSTLGQPSNGTTPNLISSNVYAFGVTPVNCKRQRFGGCC